MPRNSAEAIQDKLLQRTWGQTARHVQQSKLRLYQSGESLGADIPMSVKQNLERSRILRKTGLVLVLICFVLIAG